MAKAKALSATGDKDTKAAKRQLELDGLEYLVLKETDKENGTREAEIKESLMPLVRELGEETSEGHFVLAVGSVDFKIEKRSSPRLDAVAAEKFLSKAGLLAQAQTTVVSIDPKKVEQLYLAGKISDVELASFMDEKVVEAFIVKRNA